MTRWTLAALLLLCAAQASALDTFEPYPQGLRAAEVYAIRAGAGLGDPALRAFGAVTGVAVGLGVRSHAYGFTGISSNDKHEGGVDFLNLGYFQNLIDTEALDIDAWLELTALGEGLGASQRGIGVEVNYDGPRGGLFWRPIQHWERDGDTDTIGRRREYHYGVYGNVGPKAQVLAELVQESVSGFETLPDDRRTASWAFGFNRALNETTELILEARAVEPPDGSGLDRSWDFTVGWVVVW